jgi:hypothetical protein
MVAAADKAKKVVASRTRALTVAALLEQE